ncbi:hypothetical protein OPV22_018526 [Ensete ventricosum]|uniref:Secreted protein n=1 Tax=Ensete ventricosum TaxID=4639 RepID=A0AAV8PFY6_ENSVE|nr:hypothetical protein OPV22_018526 [Ensete ventricosum]
MLLLLLCVRKLAYAAEVVRLLGHAGARYTGVLGAIIGMNKPSVTIISFSSLGLRSTLHNHDSTGLVLGGYPILRLPLPLLPRGSSSPFGGHRELRRGGASSVSWSPGLSRLIGVEKRTTGTVGLGSG